MGQFGRVHFGGFSKSHFAPQLGLDIVDQMCVQLRMGSLGQDSVGAVTFWGFLNVSLHASGAQRGLDIVDQMCVQLKMGWMGVIS